MKKKIITFASLTAVFALGIGIAINTQKQPISVKAEQHSANYAGYAYSGTYYDSLNKNGTDGLNGTFNSALSTYVFPKAWYTYSGNGSGTLGQELQKADEDPTNSANMVLLYTRNSIKKTAATVSGVMQWNREHVWPQANSSNNWGQEKAGTDLLHLRPTYEATNSARGNKKYGYVTGSPSALTHEGMTYGYSSGNYFEPLDAVKGDVARICMYLYTTYNSYYGGNLNITNTFASYDTLLKWHTEDQPDAMEGHRNDYVQSSNQKNRNPFVDHPEYAWRIFGDSCSAAVKQACMDAYPIEGYIPNPGGGDQPGGGEQPGGQGQGGETTIPENNVYTITFANNGEDSGTLITEQNYTSYVSSNTLVKSISNPNKMYPGASGLKFGSSSATGSITFNLKDEAKDQIDAIYLKSTQYKSDSSSFTLSANGQTLDQNIEIGKDYSFTFDEPTSINSISLECAGKRAYLNSISVHIFEEQPSGGGGNTSEPPAGNSSENPVDNSSENPISSSSEISQSSSNVEQEDPCTTPEHIDDSVEENKGCNGSIIASTSLFAISSLVGLVFIFSKKRHS